MSGDATDGGPEDRRRRRLLRLLVGLAIGIPVLVEGLTFAGLLGDRFGGGDGDGGATTTATGGVRVGDVLPIDAPVETRLVAGELRQGEDAWTLELTVEVRNGGDHPFGLELSTVTTSDGAGVAGSASTGRVDPGETARVTETWALPANALPATLTVVTTTYGEETRQRAATVDLGKIPVRG